MLEASLLATSEALEPLAPEWEALWERCPGATPFQHPAWLLPWWRNLWGGGKQWWLALREGARLAGLAPLFAWGGAGQPRVVSLAGAGVSDYLDILVEPAHAVEGARAVLDWLAARRGEWDVCDFQELGAGSPLLAGGITDLPARSVAGSVCPVLRLGSSFEALAGGLPRKFRTDLHRAQNRVRNAGGVLERAHPDNLDELVCGFLRLHTARWQARGEGGVVDAPALRRFYTEAAGSLLRHGMLRLYGLRIGGELAAALYGFAGHGRFYAYLDGFDPALARLSTGTALLGCAVEHAVAEGLTKFDFLRHGEAFKYLWGASDETNRRVLVWHSPEYERFVP